MKNCNGSNTCEGPLWVHEHGAGYEVPDEILNLEGIEDHSWHNDTCPSFGLYDDLGTFLRIFVEHPDPDRREFGPYVGRYSVMFSDDDDHDRCNGVCVYLGDDVNEAVRWFMQSLPEYHATTRAKMGA